MQKNIPYLLHDVQGKQVYEVNGHFFEIIYRCDTPIPVTSEMIAEMADFAEDETKEGSRSFLNDAIPFIIWANDNYLAY